MSEGERRSVRMDATAFASFGPGQLRPGRDVDAVDGVVPQAVITPRSVENVAAAIEEARRSGLGLITVGGATSSLVGNIPEAFHIRLVMTALATKLEVNPADMTVSVEAGVTLARLNRALAAEGQRVALDPAVPERATVGGLVASDAGGGLRYAFGTCRDLLLGMKVVDGKLRRYACGSRVVKNVAGYDLPRLFTGSYGSLAVITEVTLRTHPLPECGRTLLFEFDDARELEAARTRLFAADLGLVAVDFALDLLDGRESWTLALRAEGTEAEVAYQSEKAAELAGRDIGEIAEQWWSPVHAERTAHTVLRLGLPPARALKACAGLASELRSRVGELAVGGHLGAGVVRIAVPQTCSGASGAVIDAAERVARGLREDPADPAPGANVVIEKAPVELKEGRDVWGQPRAGLDLMRGLKQRFDPERVLAPGRFVGGI